MLEDVGGIREAAGVGDKSFSNVRKRVFPLDGSDKVFGEDTVASKHPKYTLEILGIAANGSVRCEKEAREDLGSGERRIGPAVPNGVGNA